jgi:hypothetical protein
LIDGGEVTPATSPAAPFVARNALAPCVPFFEALAFETPAAVVLSIGDSARLRAELAPHA